MGERDVSKPSQLQRLRQAVSDYPHPEAIARPPQCPTGPQPEALRMSPSDHINSPKPSVVNTPPRIRPGTTIPNSRWRQQSGPEE